MGTRVDDAIPVTPYQPAHESQDRSHRPLSVLLVEPDAARSDHLRRTIGPVCALVETAPTPQHAEALSRRCHFDLYVVALCQPGCRILEWLQRLRDRGENAEILLTSDYADVDTAISALRAGASDLLVKPFRDEQLLEAIRRCLRRRRQLHENSLSRSVKPRDPSAARNNFV